MLSLQHTQFRSLLLIAVYPLYLFGLSPNESKQFNFENTLGRSEFLSLLKKALEAHRDFETDRIDLEIKHYELESSKQKYAGFVLELESDYNISHWERYKHTNSNSIYTQKQWDRSPSIELKASKQFLSNPSKLTLSLGDRSDWTDYLRYKNDAFYDRYQTKDSDSVLELTWKIPLMRQTTNATDLKSYRRNKLDYKDEQIAYAENQESFIADQLAQFYELLQLQEELKLQKEQAEVVRAISLSDPKDHLQITRTLLAIDNNYDRLLSEHKALAQALALRLEAPVLLEQPIEPAFNRSRTLYTNLNSYLSQHSRKLKRIAIDRNLVNIDIAHYKNQMRPDLDLSLHLSHDLDKGRTKTTVYDYARYDYGLSVVFKLPLIGYRSSKNSLILAQFKLEKLNHQYNRTEQDLIADIRSIEESLEQSEANLGTYPEFIRSSYANQKQEGQHYEDGNGSIEDYLNAIEDTYSAYLAQLEAQIRFERTLLEYQDLLDCLLQVQGRID
ncbi:MAG: hypothetical protein CML12_04780 [Puniceicoccaceae bacterium]|nr:hypothetical protein [Puniceicoccaceae bacterium]RCL30470.1 MAG: hypothetical protein DBX03_02250 [Puniceicoccaceae bacterium]